MSKLTMDDAIDNPVTRTGEAANDWADEQIEKAKRDAGNLNPFGAARFVGAVGAGATGMVLKTTGAVGGAMASGVHTGATAAGDVSGDAAHAVQENQWVESGTDKLKDGGGHVVEGVKKLNPLNVFKGFGNTVMGIVTLDGDKVLDGVKGIASPVVGVGEMAFGAGEAVVGGGQAATGKIGKETVNAAYYVGDKAGGLVNPERPTLQTQPTSLPSAPAPVRQEVAQTFPLHESSFTVKNMQPIPENEPATAKAETAPQTHATFKNARDERQAEAVLKDMSDFSDGGFSRSKANAVLKKLGAEQLSENAGFDDILKANEIIRQATLDWKEQPGEPSAQHGGVGKSQHRGRQ